MKTAQLHEEAFEEFETDVVTETSGDDDADVSSEGGGTGDEAGTFTEASFGAEGAPTEATSGGLEAVAGFNASILNTSRESLHETGDDHLLDAWYADLGDPGVGVLLRRGAPSVAEVVIGADDRVRITATTSYPWRAICSLRITAKDGSQWIGTGWLIGNRTLVTAGHCVYMHSRGGWAKEIEVIPGRNGTTFPYASCKSSTLRSVKGWTQDQKRDHDYGAIILPASCKYGQQLGYFGFGNYSDSTLNGLTVNLSGYPGDKPSGTQWWHARKIESLTTRTLVYNIDTAGGQSGSPVWRIKDGKRIAVGVHTNGAASGNSATRIVAPVFDNLKKWKDLGQI